MHQKFGRLVGTNLKETKCCNRPSITAVRGQARAYKRDCDRYLIKVARALELRAQGSLGKEQNTDH